MLEGKTCAAAAKQVISRQYKNSAEDLHGGNTLENKAPHEPDKEHLRDVDVVGGLGSCRSLLICENGPVFGFLLELGCLRPAVLIITDIGVFQPKSAK